MQERGVEARGFAGKQAGLHTDAGLAQLIEPLAVDPRIGVADRRHHAGDRGVDQTKRARRRVPVVRAGFEIDVHGGAACSLARGVQGDVLGVRGAGPVVQPCTDRNAVAHDHASDAGIGRRRSVGARGQRQRLRHPASIFA